EGLKRELLSFEGIAVQHTCFVRAHLLEDATQCGGERRPGLGPRRIERDPQEAREVLVLQPAIARVAFRCLHKEPVGPPRLPRLGLDQRTQRGRLAVVERPYRRIGRGSGGPSLRLCNRRHNCWTALRQLRGWWGLERARCRSRISRLVILPKWPRRTPPFPRGCRPGCLMFRFNLGRR